MVLKEGDLWAHDGILLDCPEQTAAGHLNVTGEISDGSEERTLEDRWSLLQRGRGVAELCAIEHLAAEISRHVWEVQPGVSSLLIGKCKGQEFGAMRRKQGNPRIGRNHETLGTSKEGSSPGPSEKAWLCCFPKLNAWKYETVHFVVVAARRAAVCYASPRGLILAFLSPSTFPLACLSFHPLKHPEILLLRYIVWAARIY